MRTLPSWKMAPARGPTVRRWRETVKRAAHGPRPPW